MESSKLLYNNIYLNPDYWKKRVPFDFCPIFQEMREAYVEYARYNTPLDEMNSRHYNARFKLVMKELNMMYNNIDNADTPEQQICNPEL
jgi:hypothetical protein